LQAIEIAYHRVVRIAAEATVVQRAAEATDECTPEAMGEALLLYKRIPPVRF
jgi:hypothetical protein